MAKRRIFDRVLDSILNMIYSPKKRYERILMILVLVGFILRLIAAFNLGTLADDMVFASQSAGIFDAKILSTHSNPPLFFYLNDLAFMIFGFTTFASRFWPLIMGSLLIIVSFLITKKLFNEKIALLAAFFVTFSSFLIRMTFSEHSLVVFFLSFLAVYFGMLYLDEKNLKYLIFAGILFGLGILTKYNAPFILLSFLIFSAYFVKMNRERVFSKENVKHLVLLLFIVLLLVLPILSFNYLIYKEKGIVDVYFSRVVHVEKAQELYQGLAGQDRSFFDNILNPGSYGNYNILYHTDPVLLLFGLAGIFMFFKRKLKVQLSFFLIFLIIPFILQSAGAPLQKHFVFMHFLFAIPAGYSLNSLLNKINRNGKKGVIVFALFVILIGAMFVSLGTAYGTPSNYYSKSENSQLKSYINNNVEKNDLIIFDSRIYTAQNFWLATDHNFIDLQQFVNFFDVNQQIPNEQKMSIKLHVVECVIDDCGWGWVARNQQLNSSSEGRLDGLREQLPEVESIKSYTYRGNELFGEKEKTEKFKIYSADAGLSLGLVNQANEANSFYFVPYMYRNLNSYVYNYDPVGFDYILHNLSLWIIYLSILITILVVLKTGFIPFREN
ncbi:hypothetical protein CMI45_01330 [Candidatus Pacearchaeota archaeon]|nr:hypothetical protein [Candidatus Pacearchaeota archaeon]|tara:strand:+ start:1608 stop:3437 length:1830 start_codon:yes stop_codon:yes gene_type:complete